MQPEYANQEQLLDRICFISLESKKKVPENPFESEYKSKNFMNYVKQLK